MTTVAEQSATLAVRREDLVRVDSLLSWLDTRALVAESERAEVAECSRIIRGYTAPTASA